MLVMPILFSVYEQTVHSMLDAKPTTPLQWQGNKAGSVCSSSQAVENMAHRNLVVTYCLATVSFFKKCFLLHLVLCFLSAGVCLNTYSDEAYYIIQLEPESDDEQTYSDDLIVRSSGESPEIKYRCFIAAAATIGAVFAGEYLQDQVRGIAAGGIAVVTPDYLIKLRALYMFSGGAIGGLVGALVAWCLDFFPSSR